MWTNGSANNKSSNNNNHGHGHRRGGGGTGGGGGSSEVLSTAPRDYPNLAPWCRVVVRNPNVVTTASSSLEPVELSADVTHYCRNYLSKTPLVDPYDFQLERQVLSDSEARRHEYLDGLRPSQSHDELKKSVVAKMRGVTSADETLCISILESHSYDLKTSVEAYFASPPST